MKLFHTSPAKISKITSSGRFGEFLFFSSRVYTMTAACATVYSIEIDDAEIIDADQLFYHADAASLEGLVDELADRLGIDAERAEALIEESVSAPELDEIAAEDAAEVSWDVQRYTARAAKVLGFRGVRVTDEQGAAYMIDMTGREADLLEVATEIEPA